MTSPPEDGKILIDQEEYNLLKNREQALEEALRELFIDYYWTKNWTEETEYIANSGEDCLDHWSDKYGPNSVFFRDQAQFEGIIKAIEIDPSIKDLFNHWKGLLKEREYQTRLKREEKNRQKRQEATERLLRKRTNSETQKQANQLSLDDLLED